jgi:hypothetical protein
MLSRLNSRGSEREARLINSTNYQGMPVIETDKLPEISWTPVRQAKLTRLQRFRLVVSRIPDAWRVLTGQTETVD